MQFRVAMNSGYMSYGSYKMKIYHTRLHTRCKVIPIINFDPFLFGFIYLQCQRGFAMSLKV